MTMRTAVVAIAATMLLEGFGVPAQDYTPTVEQTFESEELAEQDCGSSVNAGIASIVATYFPEDEMCTALRIVACESRGDPGAYNKSSGASGLFQVMPFWADHYGYRREALFEPTLNAEMAYRIWSEEGGWKHWECW